MSLLFGLILIPFGVLHFLPTIVAAFRDSRSLVGIFLLNLFLGWTIIGWIAALIWAFSSAPKWLYYGYPQAQPSFQPRRF